MAEGKSEAAKLREAVENRLKAVREQITPLVTEEKELVAMVPDEPAEPEAEAEQPQSVPPAKPQRRQRRTRNGGTREEQAIKLIAASPGISASEVASKMKIKPNYLYRVLGDAEKEGRVRKEDRKYFPVEA